MSQNIMNEDTITLLKECNSGCKSATNSMEQVMQYVDNKQLRELIDKYNKQHISLGDELHTLLNQMGKNEMDPDVIGKTFAWFTTEVKLMIKNDTHEITKLMMDGCNMGIQSVSEYINKCKNASKESMTLAKRIVKIEQEFMDELKGFI